MKIPIETGEGGIEKETGRLRKVVPEKRASHPRKKGDGDITDAEFDQFFAVEFVNDEGSQ